MVLTTVGTSQWRKIMHEEYLSTYAHMYINSDSTPEPTDRQLDHIDDEYHLIKKKKSKLSASKRKKIVKAWNKYKVRMGY